MSPLLLKVFSEYLIVWLPYQVYLCLLTDSLLVADLLPVKRGTIQYRLRWVFELDSLAAVDANAPSLLKMLVFPQSILFQMESLQVR